MNNQKETGHKVTIDNLRQLIAFLKSYGSDYSPTNSSLTIAQLEARLEAAEAAEAKVSVEKQSYTVATDAREEAFKPISAILTRSFNALISTNTSAETDASARALVNKIKGTKTRSSKKTTDPVVAENGTSSKVASISTAQMGYDDRLQNLTHYFDLLEITPEYQPNEPDLKLDALRAVATDLAVKNQRVMDAEVAFSKARLDRNDVLYKPITGVVDTATDVKNYVKSVFGASGAKYRQISGIIFQKF